MDHPGLSVSIRSLAGLPLVAVSGTIDAWQIETVDSIVQRFPLDDRPVLVLDLSDATFTDVESLSGLIRLLRTASGEMRIAAVTTAAISAVLRCANLEPGVTLCSTIDSAEEMLRSQPEYLTSRWMAAKAEEEELPLAA